MKVTQDLIITVFGAITSLLTALLLVWTERILDFSLYSLMVWFVVPAGALCCGFVAATGYLAGARLFHIKPRPMLMLNMIGISLGTYFLIHWLQYADLEVDGEAVADRISFWDYLDLVVNHTSYQLRAGRGGVAMGNAVELGSMGYAVAALQVLGFATGGLCTYLYLSSLPFCDRCVRYYAKKLGLNRRVVEQDELEQVLSKLRPLFTEGKLQEAVRVVADTPSNKKVRMSWFNAALSVLACTKCRRHRVHFEVTAQQGGDARPIHELTLTAFTDNFIQTTELK